MLQPKSKQQSHLSSYFDRPRIRKRPLKRVVTTFSEGSDESNMMMMQIRIPYNSWNIPWFITVFTILLYALVSSSSCITAFHPSATKIYKIPPLRRVSMQHVAKSADDALEGTTSNTNNATIVSANQLLPLVESPSSHSSIPLQQATQQQPLFASMASTSLSTTATGSSQPPSTQSSSFGDVVSLKQRPGVMNDSNSSTQHNTDTILSSSFGDVVSIRKPNASTTTSVTTTSLISEVVQPAVLPIPNVVTTISEERRIANQIRLLNTVVAVLSIMAAIGNFIYQYLHPIEPIQILFDLQQSSADISVIGKNHKPTIVDFWAPWCENCKLSAATLQSIEQQYGNDVNFILINGDLSSSWPYIEALGVDAIPHMSMISYDGIVETALIGPIPKHIIQEDIDILLLNSKNNAEALRKVSIVDAAATTPNNDNDNVAVKELYEVPSEHVELPHKMLDVFAGKPDSTRRLKFE